MRVLASSQRTTAIPARPFPSSTQRPLSPCLIPQAGALVCLHCRAASASATSHPQLAALLHVEKNLRFTKPKLSQLHNGFGLFAADMAK